MRPWLLVPKVLAVALMFGGLGASVVVCEVASGWFATLPGAEALERAAVLLRALYVYLVVPALVAAMVLGGWLLALHGRVLLRQRWVQVKLALLAVTVPSGHAVMSARLEAMREAAAQGLRDPAPLEAFRDGAMALVVIFAVVMVLGRVKPRLGQNPAKAYRGGAGRGDARERADVDQTEREEVAS